MHGFFLLLFLTGHFEPQSASQPTSRPAQTDNLLRDQVARLVADLGSRQFQVRQAAHEKLTRLGEAVTPYLLEHVEDRDLEIADRVVLLIQTPRDIPLRARVAFRLLRTGNPDWMERAVYMLYELPEEVCGPFAELAKDAEGIAKTVTLPVAERLEETRKRYARFWPRYTKMKMTRPERAEEELAMQRESDRYDAEAAYWTAYDALIEGADLKNGGSGASTRPSRPGR